LEESVKYFLLNADNGKFLTKQSVFWKEKKQAFFG
jgi:hypothetical protein